MEKIKIGKIVNTHGIKGELKVAFDDVSLFQKGMTIFIKTRTDFIEYTLNTMRVHKNHMLITIGEYNNINDVLKYKTCDVYAIRSEDEVYMSDLTQYTVVSDGKEIGKVSEIITNGAQDIIVLDNGVMIPYVDAFVNNVDDENNLIDVTLIEGMCDED